MRVQRLRDRVAVVTGASGRVGSRIAAALAREGAAVVVQFCGDRSAADAVVDEIREAGGRASAFCADLSDPGSAATLISTALGEYGRIDILVNSAGTSRDGPLLAMSDEEWQVVLDTNLTSAFYCVRAVLREFVRQRSGRIVNIASAAGQAGTPVQANYVAAKSGMIGLTRSVAREVGARGITVNAVAPGIIAAGMPEGLPEGLVERCLEMVPLGRPGSPEEVASAVVFLASDDAAYITGQVLNVDGGMIMH